MAAADFKGKAKRSLEVLVPAGTALDRLVVVGAGKPAELDANGWMKLGGTVASKLGKRQSGHGSA